VAQDWYQYTAVVNMVMNSNNQKNTQLDATINRKILLLCRTDTARLIVASSWVFCLSDWRCAEPQTLYLKKKVMNIKILSVIVEWI